MTQELDEPIEVVSYDPEWPRLFNEEAKRLRTCVAAQIDCIEHFGSTSVPGMVGKPIVDLLFGVGDMIEAHELAEQSPFLKALAQRAIDWKQSVK